LGGWFYKEVVSIPEPASLYLLDIGHAVLAFTRRQGVEAGIEESCDQPAQLTEITRLSSMAIISRTLDIAADCNKIGCI
jgi:hypothetical protein